MIVLLGGMSYTRVHIGCEMLCMIMALMYSMFARVNASYAIGFPIHVVFKNCTMTSSKFLFSN